MTELELQRQIKNILKQAGHDCWQVDSGKKVTFKTKGSGLAKGFPDIFGYRFTDGRIFFIEVKLPNGKLSKVQHEFLTYAKSHNALCGVARSVLEACEIVSGMKTYEGEMKNEQN